MVKSTIFCNIAMSHIYIKVDIGVNTGKKVEIYGENTRFNDIKGVTNLIMIFTLKSM